MPDPRGNVIPGQRLQIAASQINALNAMMRGPSGFGDSAAEFGSAPYIMVYATNSTSATLARWGILAITGVAIAPQNTPGGETAQFEQMPVLTGGTPSATTTAWCVAVEPIPAGKIGRVAVAGVVQCKVQVVRGEDKFVACKDSTEELLTSRYGDGFIIWKEPGTGAGKWALVRLASPGMQSLKLGKIASTWSKGATFVVTEQNGDGIDIDPEKTFTAKNYLATVSVASGTKRVVCGKIDDTWILIAAEC